ncbi:MAG: hypothetical protein ABSA52_04765 [Candidatus Binatia bacterium]|jgi:hypothetical protein
MRIRETLVVRLSLAVLLGLLGSAPSARAAVSVNVGSVSASPGSTLNIFYVTLTTTAGEQVAATETTIGFESETPVVQCTTNPSFAISQCALQPTGCTAGVNGNCQQTECIIAGFGGTIPNGSVLYTCDVNIASNAAIGEYALSCSAVSVLDSAGNSLNPQCTGGYVEVVAPTPTPGSGGGIACQIAAIGQSYGGWLLVFPAAALLWLRRRR